MHYEQWWQLGNPVSCCPVVQDPAYNCTIDCKWCNAILTEELSAKGELVGRQVDHICALESVAENVGIIAGAMVESAGTLHEIASTLHEITSTVNDIKENLGENKEGLGESNGEE